MTYELKASRVDLRIWTLAGIPEHGLVHGNCMRISLACKLLWLMNNEIDLLMMEMERFLNVGRPQSSIPFLPNVSFESYILHPLHITRNSHAWTRRIDPSGNLLAMRSCPPETQTADT